MVASLDDKNACGKPPTDLMGHGQSINKPPTDLMGHVQSIINHWEDLAPNKFTYNSDHFLPEASTQLGMINPEPILMPSELEGREGATWTRLSLGCVSLPS